MKVRRKAPTVSILVACAAGLASVPPARAWSPEGHRIVARIAEHYLDPSIKKKVDAILEGDTTGLTAKDMVSEATWADEWRDSDRNTTRTRYERTKRWHFVDLELEDPDLSAACFGTSRLAPGQGASQGPSRECVVDKIEEFEAELRSAATSREERRLALQFLLHFVGDVHQPLHASDQHDAGGNDKTVLVDGIEKGSLHRYWDTNLVQRLGVGASAIAAKLIPRISEQERRAWSRGRAKDWALESFAIARDDAYGRLSGPDPAGRHRISRAYVERATEDVAQQLSRAGVRLSLVLERALK